MFKIDDKPIAIYDNLFTAKAVNWTHSLMHIEEAWAKATGKNVLVGIIDTGCDVKHKDLSGKVKHCVNVSMSPGDCTDKNGHGTNVSSIVAARPTGSGVTGIAYGSELCVVKAIDDSGAGDVDNLIRAVKACMDRGCDVINMSLGSHEAYDPLSKLLQEAANKGIIIVAAAGNGGDGNPKTLEEDYPARLPYVLSVAAINSKEQVAKFSSSGHIEFAAPGVDIIGCYPGNKYATMSGTSQATPFVSGICALMKELDKSMGYKQAIDVLSKYSMALGDPHASGYGIINVGAAISAFVKHGA